MTKELPIPKGYSSVKLERLDSLTGFKSIIIFVPDEDKFDFSYWWDEAIKRRAEEMAKKMSKEYINQAISNGLEFLHKLK